MTFLSGDRVQFRPKRGSKRLGTIQSSTIDRNRTVLVLLDGDPFPVLLHVSQLSICDSDGNVVKSKPSRKSSGQAQRRGKTMTTTKPTAKELRQQAQALDVEGWEDMGLKALAAAVRKAEKTTKTKPAARPARRTRKAAATTRPAKKRVAKKAAAPVRAKSTNRPGWTKDNPDAGLQFAEGTPPRPLPDEGVNPFRPSSNLHAAAKLLLRGGVRSTLAQKMADTTELHPYQKNPKEVNLADYDKRLILAAQTMRDQYGYGVLRTGRGIDGKILVFRPGGPKDPRTKNKGKANKAAVPKRRTRS